MVKGTGAVMWSQTIAVRFHLRLAGTSLAAPVCDISDTALQTSRRRVSVVWSATEIAMHMVGKQTMT